MELRGIGGLWHNTELRRIGSTASVLQAAGFRNEITVFRLNARPRQKPARSLRFGGIWRHTCTQSRLITRRAQVQILPLY